MWLFCVDGRLWQQPTGQSFAGGGHVTAGGAQVLEARAELDSLEEIARCPLVAARADQYRSFFAAAPQLLQPAASVRHFQRALVQLLFPDAPFICAWACLPPAVQDGPKKGGTAL